MRNLACFALLTLCCLVVFAEEKKEKDKEPPPDLSKAVIGHWQSQDKKTQFFISSDKIIAEIKQPTTTEDAMSYYDYKVWTQLKKKKVLVITLDCGDGKTTRTSLEFKDDLKSFAYKEGSAKPVAFSRLDDETSP